jgi:N-acetylglucosamine-6-phosphate deacetylase
MSSPFFCNGTVVLADRLLVDGVIGVNDTRITTISRSNSGEAGSGERVDLDNGYLVPGFVDLHVHGGAGADFMDGTADAFRTVCQAHARHGTTSLLPTTTVARHDQHLAFLDVCRRLKAEGTGGAHILGAHFYGPYFAPEARGCHPAAPVRPPRPEEFEEYLAFADCITTATVAPELAGAEAFVRACRARGIHCNAGSAPCPTAPGCAKARLTPCAGVSSKRRCSSTS